MWYLGERGSICWELTDFCDVRRLADGQFSQSVCFLTWAPVSQVRTLRLCAIFLERRAAPPQEGWRPSLFNRSGLPPKRVQLSIKSVILWAPLRHPAIEWQQSAMNLIAPISREWARAYYSIWHCICKFTHLFNIILRHLRLAKSNIISADVNNNLTEFTFSISQHF